jgi:hypothetical protein
MASPAVSVCAVGVPRPVLPESFYFTAAIKKDMYGLVILCGDQYRYHSFAILKWSAAYTSVDEQVSPLNLRFAIGSQPFLLSIILLLGIFPQGFIDFAKEAVDAVI